MGRAAERMAERRRLADEVSLERWGMFKSLVAAARAFQAKHEAEWAEYRRTPRRSPDGSIVEYRRCRDETLVIDLRMVMSPFHRPACIVFRPSKSWPQRQRLGELHASRSELTP